MPHMLEARGFRVDYPDFTLGPMDFTLATGERVALLGHNGAGKSTAMRALSGRTTDYKGFLGFAGHALADTVPEVRSRIGLLPEKPAAFPWMTVGEHLTLLGALHPHWDAPYAEMLRDRLDLPIAAKVGTLSRGMGVKLSFVSAEGFRPTLLLLDEPTAGLDPGMRKAVLDMVKEAVGGDRVVVFSTHILEDIHILADRVLVLRGGQLVKDQTLDMLRSETGVDRVNDRLRDLMSGRD